MIEAVDSGDKCQGQLRQKLHSAAGELKHHDEPRNPNIWVYNATFGKVDDRGSAEDLSSGYETDSSDEDGISIENDVIEENLADLFEEYFDDDQLLITTDGVDWQSEYLSGIFELNNTGASESVDFALDKVEAPSYAHDYILRRLFISDPKSLEMLIKSHYRSIIPGSRETWMDHYYDTRSNLLNRAECSLKQNGKTNRWTLAQLDLEDETEFPGASYDATVGLEKFLSVQHSTVSFYFKSLRLKFEDAGFGMVTCCIEYVLGSGDSASDKLDKINNFARRLGMKSFAEIDINSLIS